MIIRKNKNLSQRPEIEVGGLKSLQTALGTWGWIKTDNWKYQYKNHIFKVQAIVDMADVNGDGEIDYAEFLKLVCSKVLEMQANKV